MQSATLASDPTSSGAPDTTTPEKRGISSGLKVAKNKDGRHADIPEGVQILEPGYKAREDISSLRVLIVDDNRFHRSLIRNTLMSQTINSQWEAEGVDEAEAILAGDAIDLIILDNNMPGEKGITFTQRIRQGKTKANRFTPIIMASAYGDEKVISAARNAGVHEYVLKPFNVATLLKRVVLTFKIPRDFIIAPGYVGPDRRWREKLDQDGNQTSAREASLSPGLCKPEVLVYD